MAMSTFSGSGLLGTCRLPYQGLILRIPPTGNLYRSGGVNYKYLTLTSGTGTVTLDVAGVC